MGGSLCNRAQADRSEEKEELMHPPSIVKMKHGHICKHSKIFLEQKDTVTEGEQPRKGVFYHPNIERLDTHPATRNTHLYSVYGGTAQDRGRFVYLIDEHIKVISYE